MARRGGVVRFGSEAVRVPETAGDLRPARRAAFAAVSRPRAAGARVRTGHVASMPSPPGEREESAFALGVLFQAVFGQRHLRTILAQYAAHYNGRRPHRSRQLRPPRPDHPVADLTKERIQRRPVLGGLINEYERAA